MEENKLLLSEWINKTVIVVTRFGRGSMGDMVAGDYRGTLLDYDGKFLKLEYDVKNFVKNETIVSKTTVMINSAYIITIEQSPDKPGSLFG